MIQFKVYDVGPEFWDRWNNPAIPIWQQNTDLWNTLLDTYDQYFLDLYDWDSPSLTLSIEDITDASAQSVYSKQFRVPSTPNNNQFFKFAFEISGVDFDPTVKKPAEILVNGQYFRGGHIRLNKIYYDRESNNIDYEIIFMGELRDLATTIGDRTLCDLNFDDYAHPNNYANIVQSWQAFPEGGRLDGLFEGDILYPLVEFGNTYDDSGNTLETRIASTGSVNFTQNSNPLTTERFKPMVRAKAIWDRIFQSYGFSYNSRFLESDLFRKIYISAWGTEPQVDIFSGSSVNIFSATTGNISQSLTPTKQLLRFTNEVLDPASNYDTTTSRFTAPVSGTYTFNVQGILSLRSRTSVPITGTIGIYKTPIGPNPPDIVGNSLTTTNGNLILTAQGSLVLNAGEQVAILVDITGTDVSINFESGSWSDGAFECTGAPGNVIPNYLFDCEYKQLDFIKDLITAFRLVLAPDNVNPRRFIIEPWVDFIGTGMRYDWSDKLDGTKDVTVEPLFLTQTEDIEFKFKEETDYIDQLHQDTYKYTYGRLLFLSDNDLLTGKRDVTVSFGPTPILQLEGEPNDSNFIIPHIHTHSLTDLGLEHLPIKPNTRILFYNGIQDFNAEVTFNHWHFTDGVTNHQFDYFPMVSPWENWPPTENSVILNFNNDIPYFGNNVAGINGNLGIGLFQKYWGIYISEAYNRLGKKLTANFVLDNYDLQNITFNDVILLDGNWYRPEKIIDAKIGEENSTKCELVKLIGFKGGADELVVRVYQNNEKKFLSFGAGELQMDFDLYAPGDPLSDQFGPGNSFTKAGYDLQLGSQGGAASFSFPTNGIFRMKYRWIVRYTPKMWDPFYDTSILQLVLDAFVQPTATDVDLIGSNISIFPDQDPGTSFVLLEYETPLLDLRDTVQFPINTTFVRLANLTNLSGVSGGVNGLFQYQLSSVEVYKTA